MKILITNDDGINAPGLSVAFDIAKEMTNEENITIISPTNEQSGVSHSTSYIRPCLLEKISNNKFSLEGTPADCTLAGITYLLKDNPPDLIISGVNKGHNIAEDIVYSGTIGAALEASLHGFKAISLSQYYSKRTIINEDIFDSSRNYGAKICSLLFEKADWNCEKYNVFYNVNFPPISANKVKGFKASVQGKRSKTSFFMESIEVPNKKNFLFVSHKPSNKTEEIGSDIDICSNSFISITPLNADLTYKEKLTSLEKILK